MVKAVSNISGYVLQQRVVSPERDKVNIPSDIDLHIQAWLMETHS